MTFPERLFTTRREQHLTQSQLADKAGVHKQMIFDYERGKYEPRGFILCCLADALGVTMDFLYGRTDKR